MVPRNLVGQELERHKPVQARVLGLVNNAHTAAAQFFNDAVVGNRVAENRCGVSHFACILRLVPDNCREQGWLLKNSLTGRSLEVG